MSSVVPVGSKQKQQESLTKEEEGGHAGHRGTCRTQGGLARDQREFEKNVHGRIQHQSEAHRDSAVEDWAIDG